MTHLKSYTSLEQSKVLAKILPLESADMYYECTKEEPEYKVYVGRNIAIAYNLFSYRNCHTIPCWSLAALLGVLPEGIIENYYAPNLQKENGKYSIAYGNDELLCIADNPVDACYEMILKLHELNLL